jgi:hypothetical protein
MHSKERQEGPVTKRSRYEKPVVIEYGTITTITRASGPGAFDGGSGDDGADDLSGSA